MTPDEERAAKKRMAQLFDHNGDIEIDPSLTAALAPREIAELDQLLASRHDLKAAFESANPQKALAAKTVWTIRRIDELLSQAKAKRDGVTKVDEDLDPEDLPDVGESPEPFTE